MHTIAVYVPKGGSAKTSTAVCLAHGLALSGSTALVIDLDAQGHASTWLAADPDMPTLADAVDGAQPLAACVQPVAGGVDLIAADGSLAGAEPVWRSMLGGDRWLSRELAALPHRWEYILMDCGPSATMASINALAAARWLVAPIEPAALPTMGLQNLLGIAVEARANLNPSLELLGVVPCRVDNRLAMGRDIRERMAGQLGSQLLPEIRTDSKLAEAPAAGASIFDYAPSGRAARDYRRLADEIRRRVEGVE